MKHLTLRLVVCAAMVSAIILAMAGCAAQQPGQPAGAAGGQDKVISQVKQGAITIDGDLKEWPARAWIPVDQYLYGGAMAPSADLTVNAAFAFDAEKFYLAVRATDDDIQKVDRSWRYGDGFLFTLVTDEGKDVIALRSAVCLRPGDQSTVVQERRVSPRSC